MLLWRGEPPAWWHACWRRHLLAKLYLGIIKNMNKHETTTTEIMEFLQEHMVTKTDLQEAKTELRGEMSKMKTELRGEMSKMKTELLDAMDDKLSDLKGDLVILMRKEDRKVANLVNLLKNKRVISEEEAKTILALEPFPQIF